jgi:uncharacterized protein YfiM (DUF2279 family)
MIRRVSTNAPHAMPLLPRLPLGAGAVLVALLLGTVFFLSLPGTTLWQRVVQDAGHGPVFALIAVVLLLMLGPADGRAIRSASQYRHAFLASTALGILTELLQYLMPGRSVSTMDAMHDAAGAALGLACIWSIERSLARRRDFASQADSHTRVVVAIALCAFTLLAWQPLHCARAYAARDTSFPVLLPAGPLADALFARPHHTSVTYVQLPQAYRRPGDADSMRFEFKRGTKPGLQVLEPYPDWRSHDVLVLDLTNPSPKPAQFMLRILDATHDWSHADRFNQPLVVPGAARTTIRISLEAVATSPARRRMDMGAIANVMLFARQPLDTGEFYVTRVWLE